ncbi:hypothetical protein BH20ACT24_BH20ACT24_16130 [soil metagenome]
MSADIVAEITELRRASRQVIRDTSLSEEQKRIALGRLAELSNRSALPWMSGEALWREAEPFLMTGETAPVTSAADPVEAKLRMLRARGLERCDRCGLALPDEDTLDRSQAQRLARIEEAQRFEGAVS